MLQDRLLVLLFSNWTGDDESTLNKQFVFSSIMCLGHKAHPLSLFLVGQLKCLWCNQTFNIASPFPNMKTLYTDVNFISIGQLVEFLKKAESKGPLSCDTVLKIFYQTCRAVQHMHKQKPPIIHRDLKVQYS